MTAERSGWENKRVHLIAEEFPEMQPMEYEALKADIGRNGLKTPIMLFEGMILDGRNRYRACRELRVAPQFKQFRGDRDEARLYAASANLMRRHLKQSQKAMIIAKNGLAASPVASSKENEGKIGIRDAATRYGVNHMTCYKAFYVLRSDARLADLVLKGDMSVGKAEAIIRAREGASAKQGPRRVNAQVVSIMTRRINKLARTAAGQDELRRALDFLSKAATALGKSTGTGALGANEENWIAVNPESAERTGN